MRRAIVCGLVVCGCTIENPAFELGVTEGASGTGEPATSATAASSAGSASTATTRDAADDGTGESVTASGVSGDGTGEPTSAGVTSESTTPADETAGGETTSTGGANMCPVSDHPLTPRVRLLDGAGQPIPTETCEKWTGQPMIAGIVTPAGGGEDGFTIQPTDQCSLAALGELYFGPELPLPSFPADPLCGVLRFGIHPQFVECTPAWVVVTKKGSDELVLFARFGLDDPAPPPGFPELGFTLEDDALCGCEGCCPGEPASPGTYKLAVGEGSLAEGQVLMISHSKGVFELQNIRSHLHPECADPAMSASAWKHVDWIAVRNDL